MHTEDQTTRKVALVVGVLSLTIGVTNVIWTADPSIVLRVLAVAIVEMGLLILWLAWYISQKGSN